ncbi:hypothetical protein [Kitasatospora sp. HPMI-4]|uniref:hypothetical protein n=1 Tax=Kitasatospora sp. HPMI-4 TaxID=3448443 RepID=UPI003F1A6BE6
MTEQRKQVLPPKGWRPLDDYDPQYFERLRGNGRGTPKDWAFCSCDNKRCPDSGKADGSAMAPMLGRSVPLAVVASCD